MPRASRTVCIYWAKVTCILHQKGLTSVGRFDCVRLRVIIYTEHAPREPGLQAVLWHACLPHRASSAKLRRALGQNSHGRRRADHGQCFLEVSKHATGTAILPATFQAPDSKPLPLSAQGRHVEARCSGIPLSIFHSRIHSGSCATNAGRAQYRIARHAIHQHACDSNPCTVCGRKGFVS